jgi:hypothetical protein
MQVRLAFDQSQIFLSDAVCLSPPKYLDKISNHTQPPPVSGQVKVSNLTPETRSPCWRGSGEGWLYCIDGHGY